MSAPAIGAVLEITSSRQLNFEPGNTFTLRNNDVTIELALREQRQDGDAWILTGTVTNVWPTNSQN
jgi:hypothetical protein